MPSPEPFQQHHSRSGEAGFDRQWETKAFDFVVRAVCAECNGGWMDAIGRAGEALAEPMIFGSPTTLRSSAEQEALGTYTRTFCLTRRLPSMVRPTLTVPHLASRTASPPRAPQPSSSGGRQVRAPAISRRA